MTGEASLAYLFGRLAIVEARVRAAVERRRADDPDPNDRFRGLYVSDAQVDGLLAGPRTGLVPEPTNEAAADALARLEASAAEAEAQATDVRLRRLGVTF